jgi:hypothetical protein
MEAANSSESVGNLLPDYTAAHPRRRQYQYSPPWELPISWRNFYVALLYWRWRQNFSPKRRHVYQNAVVFTFNCTRMSSLRNKDQLVVTMAVCCEHRTTQVNIMSGKNAAYSFIFSVEEVGTYSYRCALRVHQVDIIATNLINKSPATLQKCDGPRSLNGRRT